MSSRARERIRLEWEGSGVTLTDVLGQLTRLHSELGRRAGTEGDGHPHPRNCVMNLVAVVPDPAAARRVQEAGSALSELHPLRVLALEVEPAHHAERLDAWIAVEAHEVAGGRPIQAEVIRLHVKGSAAEHVAPLLEPLLVPDVPTFLWWLGTPPLGARWFEALLHAVDVLVVDSASFERPFLTTIELAARAERLQQGSAVADLQWARLESWRELVAQVFAPADRRPFLDGMSALGVDYTGEGRGNRVAAALLTGWVAARLGWRLLRAVGGAGGTVVAHFESGAGGVEVRYRSVPAAGLAEGELSAVRLEASGRGTTFRATLERDRGPLSRVRTELAIGEAVPLEDWRPVDVPSEPQLLLALAGQPRDPVFPPALRQAAELLRALR